jgi:hypothetical protein
MVDGRWGRRRVETQRHRELRERRGGGEEGGMGDEGWG